MRLEDLLRRLIKFLWHLSWKAIIFLGFLMMVLPIVKWWFQLRNIVIKSIINLETWNCCVIMNVKTIILKVVNVRMLLVIMSLIGMCNSFEMIWWWREYVMSRFWNQIVKIWKSLVLILQHSWHSCHRLYIRVVLKSKLSLFWEWHNKVHHAVLIPLIWTGRFISRRLLMNNLVVFYLLSLFLWGNLWIIFWFFCIHFGPLLC